MSKERPLLPALLLGLVASALFLFRIAVPSGFVFDEVHYVPAARTLGALAEPVNIEHPLLAKELIGLGMRLFGDDALGWRFFSAVAGVATVLGLYAIGWLAFGRVRPGVLAGGLGLLNFTIVVQARIAMLDGMMAAFVVLGMASMLWAMRGGRVRARLALTGALLGLAVAAKWAAVPYLAFAAIAFLLTRNARRWPGVGAVAGLAILTLASFAAYLLTFLPAFFYASHPLTLATLLPFQAEMYHAQTLPLPHHTYQSSWWSWPLMLRPIWYFYAPADGALRGILLIGNPAVMWGGLAAVAACLWLGWRESSARLAGIGMLWIAGFGVWALIPKKIGFFYYYYLPGLFLTIALAAVLDRMAVRLRWAFIILAAGLFAYFYPILAAMPLDDADAFHRWAWFDSWI